MLDVELSEATPMPGVVALASNAHPDPHVVFRCKCIGLYIRHAYPHRLWGFKDPMHAKHRFGGAGLSLQIC